MAQQKLSLGLKQTQQLLMTPQLQQAIKLLTLTHLEMTNVIAEELVENPMLEELGAEAAEEKTHREEDEYNLENIEMQNKEASTENFEEKALLKTDNDDFDWRSYADSFNSTYQGPSMVTAESSEEMPTYENIVSKGESLTDHLLWQLRMENLSQREMALADMVIHNLNEDGYLELSFEEIIHKHNIEREDAFDILFLIQKLDPVGCACMTLKESLLVQAKTLLDRSPLVELIIRDHLEDLQRRDFEKIVQVTGVSKERIKDAALVIHNFNPKPGRLISSEETQYVVPDIYVVKMGDEFVVQVNDDGVPRLRISKLYEEILKKGGGADPKAREYVEDKLRSARWLIKSIQNRQSTIIKVSKALVAKQQEFFKKGPQFLRPMILKDIADEIGMHESTVSRVTTNKYMHTPIGLFELKYFFNTGLGGKDGGVDVASEVLKQKLKALIDNENAKKPLSDQKIVELLSREDINVARRTIAKYREMMGIASSSDRKQK